MKIDLIKNTISNEEIDALRDWLGTYPKLTQGNLVRQLEEEFSKWQGRKYSVFVGSGSAANLILSYYYRICSKANRVIVPALSWATTLSPWLQFGFRVDLCDACPDTLGLNPTHLEELLKSYAGFTIVFAANILGFPNKYTEITQICEKYGAILIEDSCETMGSTLNGIKAGNFGEAATFSSYFAHTISTIEGGFISTDSEMMYETLKMLRAHGWSRDVSESFSKFLMEKYSVSEFDNKFTFYIPGFNVRNTEIAAFLGLSQLKRIDTFCKVRERNFKIYQDNIKSEWKVNPVGENISNFAYPIITEKRDELVAHLSKNQIDCRPLIAGNLARHPFCEDYDFVQVGKLPFADKIHKQGLYLPNNHEMTEEEVLYVCEKVNEVLV